MKKRFLAVLLTMAMLLSALPASALAAEGNGDGEAPVVCTESEDCEAIEHTKDCPRYAEPDASPEDDPANVSSDPDAGPVYDIGDDTTVIDPEQEEPVQGPTAEEQLAEMIEDLPDPEDIDPLDEEQVEAVYNQISAIYAFAEANGLGNSDDGLLDEVADAIVNAVIAAAWPPEPVSLTEIGGTLSDGTYTVDSTLTLTEQVTISGNVTISGSGTIKRGEGLTTYMIVVPEGSSLTLNGVTIDGGAVWSTEESAEGYDSALGRSTTNTGVHATAAMIYNFGMLTITGDTVLKNNSNESGRVNESGVPIFATTIQDDNGYGARIMSYPGVDEETSYGGAVLNGGTMTISGGTIEDNQAFRGAGVCSYGILTMTGGSITTNHTVAVGDIKYADGAGIYLSGGKNNGTEADPLDWTDESTKESYCTISGGSITENVSVGNGGGVIADSYSKLYLSGNVSIEKNTCGREYTSAAGGGVSLYRAYGEISGGTISENTSEQSNAGGINVSTSSTLKMTGGTVSENKTAKAGGGIAVTSGSIAELSGNVKVTKNSANNGGGIYVANGDAALTINGAEITENTAKVSGAGVYVYWNTSGSSSAVMTSGSITKNTVESTGTDAVNIVGGGVHVSGAGASFELKGGTIGGNSLTLDNGSTANLYAQGAGVCVGNGGSFTLSGGTIGGEENENTIEVKKSAAGNAYAYGAGVSVATNSKFTMTGDSAISYNSAKAADAENSSGGNVTIYGGGLYSASTDLTLTGGCISQNSAEAKTEKSGNAAIYGGGVYLGNQSGDVTVGVDITCNSAKAESSVGTATVTGGGLYVTGTAAGSITLSGKVNENTAEAASSNGSYNATAQGGGVYTNVCSLMLTGAVDGNKLTANNSATNTKVSIFGGGLYSASGSLSIADGASISSNVLTSSGSGGGGGLRTSTNTTATMNGGEISNNIAKTTGGNGQIGGGGVDTAGTFIINGGDISGNVADGYWNGGGAVRVNGASASVTLNAGTISENIATNSSVAASSKGGGAFYMVNDGTLNICGGTITGNAAYNGGAITFIDGAYTRGEVNITGGTITGNYCTNGNGGAIYMPSAATKDNVPYDQTVKISGNPVITGNCKGATITKSDETYSIGSNNATTENNIHLANNTKTGATAVSSDYANNQTLVLDGALTSGANIGVTMQTTTAGTTVAQGTDSYTVTEGDALYFSYDGGNELIQKAEGDNKIVLADTGSDSYCKVTLTLPEDGSVKANRATTALIKSGGSYSVTLTAEDGYEISSVKIGGDTTIKVSTDTYELEQSITGDITIEVTSAAKDIVVETTNNTSTVKGTYGTSVNHQLTVSTAYTGEANSEIALTYELKNTEGNALPTGLTLSKDGEISGTPEEVTTDKKVTVVATADNGSTAEIELTITINKATPTISLADMMGVTYTGEAISMTDAVVTLVNDETYTGEVIYTYYSNDDCTEALAGAPSDVGIYYVKASVAETEYYEAAESSAAKLEIDKKTFTVSADGYSGVYDRTAHFIEVHNDEYTTVTYSTDGTNYRSENYGFTDVGEYTVYYEAVKANHEEYTNSATVKITQAEQTASPAVPTCASRTATSITLTAVADNAETGAAAEYSKDGGDTWQDSNIFTGLTADTKYTFAVRYKETTNYKASASSTAEIYTSNSGDSGGGSSSGGSTTYTVTVDSTKNGTVSVSPKNASKGTTVTITVKPNSGYELDDLTVTDKNGDAVKLTRKSDTQYTFTMPASKVTVEASFTEIEEQPAVSFVDVPTSAYYYDAVAWAVENGVTSGTSATTFSPDAACTRAQAVTFLWRAAGSPVPKSSVNPFTDVSTNAYYYDAVLWAVEQGITAGTSATTFSPDATCTRGQIVTFLYRADGTAATGGNPFTDVADSAYYADAVKWAVAEGVTAGTSTTTFSPNASCTRAQIVTFLYRAYA